MAELHDLHMAICVLMRCNGLWRVRDGGWSAHIACSCHHYVAGVLKQVRYTDLAQTHNSVDQRQSGQLAV